MSKRFDFWPHIIHVIVLTFKEIKHLSDYRTVELSDRRTIGLSDYSYGPIRNIEHSNINNLIIRLVRWLLKMSNISSINRKNVSICHFQSVQKKIFCTLV